MSKSTPMINNFNAGELSPLVDARSNIEKYYSGCRKLENFVPLIEGGAKRMPGSYYVTGVKTDADATRIIPFHFSTTQAYVLEFGDLYIRFYRDEGQIQSAGNPYEIVSPYGKADLFALKYIQSADTMYLFHPDYPPKKLTRTGHTSWTIVDYPTKLGDEMVITGISQAATAVVTCTTVPTTLAAGDIVYIAAVAGMTEVNDLYFTAGTVVTGAGGTIELSGIDSTGYTAYDSAGTVQENLYGTTNNCPACGTFFEQRVVLGGSHNNPQRLDLSVSGDYEDFTLNADEDDAGIQFTLVSDKVDRIRWMSSQDILMVGTVGGIWRVGATSSIDPITQINISSRKQVYLGAANLEPEIVADALLWVTRAGTSVRQLLYSFERDKWIAPDMTRIAKHITKGSTLALTGITQMDFMKEPHPILWAVRADGQLLGFTYETEENVFAWFRIVHNGNIKSVAIISDENEEDQIWIIVERTINGSTVQYVEYFKSFDFFSEIKDCFFVQSGLTWDGGAAVIITGITRANPAVVSAVNTFSGGELIKIKDVVGMTESNTGLTKAWTVANPTGTTFELSGITSVGWGDYTSGGTAEQVLKIVTGLGHLEGESVDILIDGAVAPRETVASSQITIDWYGNLIHVGKPITSTIEPMKPNAGSNIGTARGKKQKINKFTIIFYETRGGKIGPNSDNLKIIPFGTGVQPVLFTGDKEGEFFGNWENEATMTIVQDQPLPMTVLGIVPRVTVNEE